MPHKEPKDPTPTTIIDIVASHADAEDPILSAIAETPPQELAAAVNAAEVGWTIRGMGEAFTEKMEDHTVKHFMPVLDEAQGDVAMANARLVASSVWADMVNEAVRDMALQGDGLPPDMLATWDAVNRVAELDERMLNTELRFWQEVQAEAAAAMERARTVRTDDINNGSTLEATKLAGEVRTLRNKLARFGKAIVFSAGLLIPAAGAGYGVHELSDESPAISQESQRNATIAAASTAGAIGGALTIAATGGDVATGRLAKGAARRKLKKQARRSA